MRSNIFLLALLLVFSFSCKEKKEAATHNKGSIKISADRSFKNVTEALAERYMAFYPDTKIEIEFKKEDSALLDLLQHKSQVIILSRNITQKELDLYKEQIDLDFLPSNFAADPLVFVVPATSSITEINYDEIKPSLLSKEEKFIFDGANSSNLNFVLQKFNLKQQQINYGYLPTNEEIIEELDRFPGKVGVIALNTISRPFGEKEKALRDKIKVLPVRYKGKLIEPSPANIQNNIYPLTRILYFATNEGRFGLGNGFIRFSCMQIGQLVVAKEGLQPYNLFTREVQMK